MTAQEIVNEINRRRIPTISEFIKVLPKIAPDVRSITLSSRQEAETGLTFCSFRVENDGIVARGFNVNVYEDWDPTSHGYIVADTMKIDDGSDANKEPDFEII